jgi:hypothetical protein
MRLSLTVLLLLLFCNGIYAQEKSRYKKPINVKAPAKPKEVETTPGKDNTPPTDTRYPGFDPHRELSIVNEDTMSLDEGELEVVEISEEVKVDSVWIKIADYFAIWDSRHINPYGMDPTKFEDTVDIELYNNEKKQLWSSPLNHLLVTSQFGMRGYRWHYGTDLELDTGDSVKAAFDGIVRIVRFDPHGYGYYVLLRHYNGLETLYGHLSKQLVEVGKLVKAGDLIGWGGNTGRSSGPHLHYEVRYQGNAFNAGSIYDFDKAGLLDRLFTLTPRHFSYFSHRKQAVVRRTVHHVVRRGETLSSLARKYGTSVSKLSKLNRLSTRSGLRVGQKLRVR